MASLLQPHVDEMEDQVMGCVDCTFFDGASNVQGAAHLLAVTYPRIQVVHGAEHVVSLVFGDIFQLAEPFVLNKICARTYNMFGSGSKHACYAMFQKYSKHHNNGKNIGFLRVADTRMGGKGIRMIRQLRLKDALLNTLTSADYLALKVSLPSFLFLLYHLSNNCSVVLKEDKNFTKLLQNEKLWEDMLLLMKCLYPLLVVLRLADTRTPAMDRLYFYVRQTDKALKANRSKLNGMGENYGSEGDNDGEGNKYQRAQKRMVRYWFDDETIDIGGKLDSVEYAEDEDVEDDDDDTEDNGDNASVSSLPSCDSVLDRAQAELEEGLGDKILQLWKNRKSKLCHDMAIAGWMVSPHRQIMKDVAENHNGKSRKICNYAYCNTNFFILLSANR